MRNESRLRQVERELGGRGKCVCGPGKDVLVVWPKEAEDADLARYGAPYTRQDGGPSPSNRIYSDCPPSACEVCRDSLLIIQDIFDEAINEID